MKVIIVDDERHARESLKRQMKKLPQITGTVLFDNPHKACEYARENTVDVAFLDVEMPEMDGMEMTARIKTVSPETNIVFVTGHSHYAVEAFNKDASDYLLKPATAERIESALARLRNPVMPITDKKLRVQCFGNFEVFADGKPLEFARSKSKELLAYLINKNGAFCGNNEIIAAIWEDKKNSLSTQNQFRNLVLDLKRTLKNSGNTDVIIKQRGLLAVVPDKIACDLYDFSSGKSVNRYMGEYMAQYSWAEFMNAYLEHKGKSVN